VIPVGTSNSRIAIDFLGVVKDVWKGSNCYACQKILNPQSMVIRKLLSYFWVLCCQHPVENSGIPGFPQSVHVHLLALSVGVYRDGKFCHLFLREGAPPVCVLPEEGLVIRCLVLEITNLLECPQLGSDDIVILPYFNGDKSLL